MSTPPLLNLPTSVCFASVVMSLRRVVGRTQSPFTLEEQAFKWPGEQWGMELTMPPIKGRALAEEWISFMLQLEGSYGYVLMGDPSAKNPEGVASGTPQVDGINQTGNTLLTKGWTPNVTGILKRGDYLQLGTGTNTRLHKVMADVNSDGSGNAALSIVPALRNSPGNSDPIVVYDAKGLFRLTANDFAWSVEPGNIYRFRFNAVEVVNA